MTDEMTEARPPRFPDSLVLICGLILLAQVATYVLPAGEYERQDNRVVQGTYHTVDTEPLPVLTFLTAVPAGLSRRPTSSSSSSSWAGCSGCCARPGRSMR